MMKPTRKLVSVVLLATIAAACATPGPIQPISAAAVRASEPDNLQAEPTVQAEIVAGQQQLPVPAQSVRFEPKNGNIRLNFPSSDVRVVAKATLGDILRVPYTVSADVAAPVSVVTPRPISRASLIPFLEEAFRAGGLALIAQNGGFSITPLATARSSGAIGSAAVGYSSESVRLQFVAAEEMRKLLDSVIPGTVISTDATSNAIVIAGTSGQRASARDLLRQFDVNWLRSMSFAMLVPQRTDSRLIVPELEKLINASDAPTRGLVRLISMERLNGILAISAQPQYLDDVRRWVEILDRQGQNSERRLFVYTVQNGRSRDLARTLNAAFGNGGGGRDTPGTVPIAPGFEDPSTATSATTSSARSNPQAEVSPARLPGNSSPANTTSGGGSDDILTASITSDETNNAIIVYGTPRQYAVIEDALRKLDVLPFQVLIEAAITEVSLTDDLRFGVQWNFAEGNSNFALSEGATATPTRIFPGFSYFYGGPDITATLNALEKRTNIKVISAPKLLVLNNQTAALQVGNEVPIASQSAVSVTNPDAPIVNAIEYRSTGVISR